MTRWCANSAANPGRRGRDRPARAGGAGLRRARAAGALNALVHPAVIRREERIDGRIRGARAAWNRGGGSRHPDRNRQLPAFDKLILVTCREEQQVERALRREGALGRRRARPPEPPDAPGGETKVCGFRHRYIRGERGYAAADPGRLRGITENRIMRVLRTFLWAAAAGGRFICVTSVANWDVGRALRPVATPAACGASRRRRRPRASRPTSRTISTSIKRRATPR